MKLKEILQGERLSEPMAGFAMSENGILLPYDLRAGAKGFPNNLQANSEKQVEFCYLLIKTGWRCQRRRDYYQLVLQQ